MTDALEQRRAPERGVAVVEVDLHRLLVDDNTEDTDVEGVEVWWHAEWGLAGDSTGHEHSSPDLAHLVQTILNDIHHIWAGTYPEIRIDWRLGGQPPPEQTIQNAVAETGTALPDRLPTQAMTRP